MDITIRNIDEEKYRHLKARAALSKKTIGELVTEAISLFLNGPYFQQKTRTFLELPTFDLGEGNINLSTEVDAILYDKNK